MATPRTEQKTFSLIDGTMLDYYWARDGHGGGCQNYTHYAADGTFIKLYTLNNKTGRWPEALEKLLAMRFYTYTTNTGVVCLAELEVGPLGVREARVFPSREEAQAIVDILGTEWEVRSGDKAGKYIMVSKIKQESAAPVAQ